MKHSLLISCLHKFAQAANETAKNDSPIAELGSSIEPIIISSPKNETERNIQRVQQQGKRIGKASWSLNDSEFVLGNRYRKLPAPIKVVPAKKTDMSSPNAKKEIIRSILNASQSMPFFNEIKNSPAALQNIIQNLMGMKTAEGSASNFNIGNIQVGFGKNGTPNQFWNQAFLVGDKNFSPNGSQIPYIELFRSYPSLKNGTLDWISFLISHNMISISSPQQFYHNLRKNQYFGSNLSKSPIKQHESNYVNAMNYGIKKLSPIIQNEIISFLQ